MSLEIKREGGEGGDRERSCWREEASQRERLGFVMSIWKQCNLAEAGSGEGTNVCLMWDCPGHVIAVFTRRRETERRI